MFDVQETLIFYHTGFIKHKMEIPILFNETANSFYHPLNIRHRSLPFPNHLHICIKSQLHTPALQGIFGSGRSVGQEVLADPGCSVHQSMLRPLRVPVPQGRQGPLPQRSAYCRQRAPSLENDDHRSHAFFVALHQLPFLRPLTSVLRPPPLHHKKTLYPVFRTRANRLAMFFPIARLLFSISEI